MSGHPILIVDLEATCWDSSTSETQPQTLQSMEIIEIGAVAVASHTGKVHSEFQSFVRPVRHPNLFDFCREFTSSSRTPDFMRWLTRSPGLTEI